MHCLFLNQSPLGRVYIALRCQVKKDRYSQLNQFNSRILPLWHFCDAFGTYFKKRLDLRLRGLRPPTLVKSFSLLELISKAYLVVAQPLVQLSPVLSVPHDVVVVHAVAAEDLRPRSLVKAVRDQIHRAELSVAVHRIWLAPLVQGVHLEVPQDKLN